MLAEGEAAHPFTLPGSDGVDVTQYQLSDYTGTGAVVLLFYPFDYSPVCTEELCNFRDSEWLTVNTDVDVFGISTDSAFAHRSVIEEHGLPFPLLSDHDGAVSEAYGVLYDELEGHPRVSKRAVFVIDETGTVRYRWVADEWTDDPDIGAVGGVVNEILRPGQASD